MTEARQALGELGERVAARWLERCGWRILERRYRCGHRDIDLVIGQGDTVAFVEVKTRRTTLHGDPTEAVNWRKRKELARSAQAWIDRRQGGIARGRTVYRFDVVAVLIEGGRVRVRHVPDAFRLPVRPPSGD